MSTPYLDKLISLSSMAVWGLNETSGTDASDELANYPGTYEGGPTLGLAGSTNDAGTSSISLDGVDDRVAIPWDSQFNNIRTIAFRIKRNGGGHPFALYSGGSDSLDVQVSFVNDQLECRVNSTSGVQRGSRTDFFFSSGVWYSVVIVLFAAPNARHLIYVDGELKTTVDPDFFIPSGNAGLKIGSSASNSGWLNAQLDAFAVHTSAWTATQIADLHALASATPVRRRRRSNTLMGGGFI